VVLYSAQYCSNSNCCIIWFTEDLFECMNEVLFHCRDMYVELHFVESSIMCCCIVMMEVPVMICPLKTRAQSTYNGCHTSILCGW